ncbi:MAG: tetratricopeptide repeat protein [Candidatus Eremiobacteraeota bacterium]|nr:tetratricopeptide repeat protein [Candidatus Eremiobacteraeota bacterium]
MNTVTRFLVILMAGLLFSSCSQKNISVEELNAYFDRGLSARDNLDFDRARKEFLQVIQKAPNSPESFRANLEIYEIDYQERWFKGKKEPVLKGWAFIRERNKFLRLVKKLDRLSSRISPVEEAEFRKRLAEFFSGIGARQEAIKEYEKAIGKLPYYSKERFYLLPKIAMEYHLSGDESSANKYIKSMEKTLLFFRIEPDYEQAFQLGQTYYHMGKYEPAEKWLLIARAKSPMKDPTDLTQELMISRLYLYKNDIPKALESLDIFVSGLKKIEPRKFYTDRLFGMMLTYWWADLPFGKFKTIELKPVLKHLHAAQSAFDKDDLEGCIKELEELINLLHKNA